MGATVPPTTRVEGAGVPEGEKIKFEFWRENQGSQYHGHFAMPTLRNSSDQGHKTDDYLEAHFVVPYGT